MATNLRALLHVGAAAAEPLSIVATREFQELSIPANDGLQYESSIKFDTVVVASVKTVSGEARSNLDTTGTRETD